MKTNMTDRITVRLDKTSRSALTELEQSLPFTWGRQSVVIRRLILEEQARLRRRRRAR